MERGQYFTSISSTVSRRDVLARAEISMHHGYSSAYLELGAGRTVEVTVQVDKLRGFRRGGTRFYNLGPFVLDDPVGVYLSVFGVHSVGFRPFSARVQEKWQRIGEINYALGEASKEERRDLLRQRDKLSRAAEKRIARLARRWVSRSPQMRERLKEFNIDRRRVVGVKLGFR